MSQHNAKPVAVFRAGCCQASVWVKKAGKDKRPTYSVTVQKRYRDEHGEWQTTQRYFRDELPLLALVTEKAYEYIALRSKEAEEAA
jgi:hypothetical protein